MSKIFIVAIVLGWLISVLVTIYSLASSKGNHDIDAPGASEELTKKEREYLDVYEDFLQSIEKDDGFFIN